VGISLDFDPPIQHEDQEGVQEVPEDNPEYWPPDAGYDRPIDFLPLSRLPTVCDETFRVGFTETEFKGVLGGNFRRVAERVWK
jgi:microsomal dipeptidase-like Zn-dependent dipeptidase